MRPVSDTMEIKLGGLVSWLWMTSGKTLNLPRNHFPLL